MGIFLSSGIKNYHFPLMKTYSFFLFYFLTISLFAQDVDTEYSYEHQKITIKNSLPKGGLKYTDQYGSKYTYVVFYSEVINTSDSTLHLSLKFPSDVYPLTEDQEVNFSFYLPSESMTEEKKTQFMYGLDVENYLINNLGKSTKMNKEIQPNSSSYIYVLAVSNKGVNGTVRAELVLKDDALFYQLNGLEIKTGLLQKLNN